MKIKMLPLASLFVVAISFSATLNAEPSGYYRWKDQEGNLKLSDRPPAAGINAEFIKTPGSKKSRSDSEASSSQSGEKPATDTKQPEQPLKMDILPPKDPGKCKQARSNMQAFEGHSRIRVTDPDGTQRLISEEEKQVQMERSKKAITDNCE